MEILSQMSWVAVAEIAAGVLVAVVAGAVILFLLYLLYVAIFEFGY